MYLMPLPFLLGTLAGFLSIAILAGSLYVVWAWYVGELVSLAWLTGNVAMLLWSAYGRLAVLAFYPRGNDEPQPLHSENARKITAPDGSTLPEAGVGMSKMMPNAQVIRIDPAGHNGLLEEGQQYSDAIACLFQAASRLGGQPRPAG